MLKTLGIQTVDRVAFDDHHAYRPSEMRRLAQQFLAERPKPPSPPKRTPSTSAKAAPRSWDALPVYWLKIRMEIEREEEFLRFVESRLALGREDNWVRHA